MKNIKKKQTLQKYNKQIEFMLHLFNLFAFYAILLKKEKGAYNIF